IDLTAIEATRGRRGVARDLLGARFVAGARTGLAFLAVLVEPGALAFRAVVVASARVAHGGLARISHSDARAGPMQSAGAALAVPHGCAGDSDGSLNAVHQRHRHAQVFAVLHDVVVVVTVSVFHLGTPSARASSARLMAAVQAASLTSPVRWLATRRRK